MSLCWQEKLRTMGPLYCYLIILQILCCTLVSSEVHHSVMKDEFVQSQNSILQAVWGKEPFIFCNIPKPPDTTLENKFFLTFSFDQFLCVILYDISNRYAHIQPIEPSSINPENLVHSVIENSPPPQSFCQKMKENVWFTDNEENTKWFQKFSNVMSNLTSCNKYCVADVVNPLCAYILWLDSSLKVKLNEKLPALTQGHKSRPLSSYAVHKQESYKTEPQKFQDDNIDSHGNVGLSNSIDKNLHALPSIPEESHFLPYPTTMLPLAAEKSSTKANMNIHRSGSNPYSFVNQPTKTKTVSGFRPAETSHDSKTKDSRPHYSPSSNNSPTQLDDKNHYNDVEADTFGLTGSKPITPPVRKEHLPIGSDIKHQVSPEAKEQPTAQVDGNTFSDFLGSEKKGKGSSAVTDTAASNSKIEISTKKNDEMLDKSDQYTRKDVQPPITITDNKNGEVDETGLLGSTRKSEYSKTEITVPAIPEAKQTSSGTDLNKKENKQLTETNPPKPNLELENGNTPDEGISDAVGANEPDNHENLKAMDEAEGKDDVDSVSENQENPSEIMDVTSPTHIGGENDSPPLKSNTSPKISEYADDLSDEDSAMPMNGVLEKGTQNDAGAGIYVHDRFVDAEDSHFFAYFMTMIVLCILGYLIFHNKQKILALALEGRVRKGNRRRPSTSGYRKLDSNLEEAVTSNCSGASVTHVIY